MWILFKVFSTTKCFDSTWTNSSRFYSTFMHDKCELPDEIEKFVSGRSLKPMNQTRLLGEFASLADIESRHFAMCESIPFWKSCNSQMTSLTLRKLELIRPKSRHYWYYSQAQTRGLPSCNFNTVSDTNPDVWTALIYSLC